MQLQCPKFNKGNKSAVNNQSFSFRFESGEEGFPSVCRHKKVKAASPCFSLTGGSCQLYKKKEVIYKLAAAHQHHSAGGPTEDWTR